MNNFKVGDWVIVRGNYRQIMSIEFSEWWGCNIYRLRNEREEFGESALTTEEVYNSPLYKAMNE